MEKFITDERTGLRYELVGDYYLIAGDDEPEEQHTIGIWGQRHLRYLKEHRRVLYANLLTTGKLNSHLADIDQQADEMFDRLTKQMVPQSDTEVWEHEQKPLKTLHFLRHGRTGFSINQRRNCHE